MLSIGSEGVETRAIGNDKIRVTTLERTFVDLLNRLDLAPEPHQLFDLFAAQQALDFGAMIRFARLVDNRTTAGRVAVFLMYHSQFPESGPQWRELERLTPKAPTYFDRLHRDPGYDRLTAAFNMIVSQELRKRFDQSWRVRNARKNVHP